MTYVWNINICVGYLHVYIHVYKEECNTVHLTKNISHLEEVIHLENVPSALKIHPRNVINLSYVM